MADFPTIIHIDMDAFFAAIEQRDNPHLLGKPVVVGADPAGGRGRGVVSTCSYEARAFGIHSAMPISQAFARCPDAAYLPVAMEKYAQESGRIMQILNEFTPLVEMASIDEAFLNITGSIHLFGSARALAQTIKKRIREQVGLGASLGIAPTKMAAKIASDLEKPDGLVEVEPEELLDFLWPLPLSKVWGLGKKGQEAFQKLGICTIGDLARYDVKCLAACFGNNGFYFWQLAHGIDQRQIELAREIKSVSNEVTFQEDTTNPQLMRSTLLALSEKVSGRLRADGLKGKTVTIRIRLTGFQTYTRAHTMNCATNFADVIFAQSRKLLDTFDRAGRPVRLLGVTVSRLSESTVPDTLFTETKLRKKEDIHRAIEHIQAKFGSEGIYRAGKRLFNR